MEGIVGPVRTGGSMGGPGTPPGGVPRGGGSRGDPPGGPGGSRGGPRRRALSRWDRVDLKHQHLSRLGELLNTLENVHPRDPPPGGPPGGPPRGVRDPPPGGPFPGVDEQPPADLTLRIRSGRSVLLAIGLDWGECIERGRAL